MQWKRLLLGVMLLALVDVTQPSCSLFHVTPPPQSGPIETPAITNHTFASGLSGWTSEGSVGEWQADSTSGQDDSSSVKLVAEVVGGYRRTRLGLDSDPITVTENRRYRLTFYAKPGIGWGYPKIGNQISVGVSDSDAVSVFISITYGTDWTAYTIDFTSTGSTVTINIETASIKTDAPGIEAVMWFDNFSMESLNNFETVDQPVSTLSDVDASTITLGDVAVPTTELSDV